MTRRLFLLYLGLVLYGFSDALLVRADLGVDPWDVLHQGLSLHTGLSFGTIIIAVGALVLLLWIPIRQKPGLGTVSNVFLIGLAADATLAVIPPLQDLALRSGVLVSAVVLNGLASGMYIGAGFGPGPRDGLMTGFSGRYGLSIRLVRTSIEITVLAAGWLLGGSVNVGTLLYALSIGPIIQLFLPMFQTARPQPAPLSILPAEEAN